MTTESTLATDGDWTQQLLATLPGFDFQVPRGATVRGSLRLAEFGGMHVAAIQSDAVEACWTPPAGSPAEPRIKVVFQTAGLGLSTQDGREARAEPGDFFLLDDSRPYRLRFDDSFQQHSFEVPQSLLPEFGSWRSGLMSMRIDGRCGPARFLRQFIGSLVDEPDAADHRAAVRLRDHALELLRTAIYDQCQNTLAPADRRHMDLIRAMAHVRDRLDDPELDVASVAAALGISTRSLYSLFQTQGLTVARWIREQRLERCRRAFHDAENGAASICEIALRHGFNDPAHFSTAFHTRFGVTPKAYRRLAGNRSQGSVD